MELALNHNIIIKIQVKTKENNRKQKKTKDTNKTNDFNFMK